VEATQNEQQEAKRFPFDFDALQKGDYITPEKLTEIIGSNPDTQRYKFKVLRIIKQMRAYLFSKGLVWTIKVEKGGIRICSDKQAAVHNPKEYEGARKYMKRLYAQNAAVDINNLTTEEQAVHMRRLQVQGMEITALHKSRIEALRSLHEIETE